jgi:hypothetical protein
LKIVSQQGDGKELFCVDVSLFDYSEGYEKPIDVVDCAVRCYFGNKKSSKLNPKQFFLFFRIFLIR